MIRRLVFGIFPLKELNNLLVIIDSFVTENSLSELSQRDYLRMSMWHADRDHEMFPIRFDHHHHLWQVRQWEYTKYIYMASLLCI